RPRPGRQPPPLSLLPHPHPLPHRLAARPAGHPLGGAPEPLHPLHPGLPGNPLPRAVPAPRPVGADGGGEPCRLGRRGLALRPAARDARGGGVTDPQTASPEAAPAAPADRPEAIRVEGLVKLYRRTTPGDQLRTLKSALVEGRLTPHLKREDAIVALEGIDFSVSRGEAFGVIGGTGSGKSTLLKLVAGMLKPSAGKIAVAGRVAAMIELGAGFHPEISG